jgi:hypothetical protein
MSFYDATVPAFLQILGSLSTILGKAEAHCQAKGIQPSEVPSTPDTEKTFEELRQRIAKTIDYVKSFKPAQFDGADARDVTFPAGPNNQITLKGQQFLSSFSFPNFYFHAAIAHGILRHNGVEIGKRDFLGVR